MFISGLYQKFTTSINFQDWLSRKKADLERQLRLLHLEVCLPLRIIGLLLLLMQRTFEVILKQGKTERE